MNTNLTPDREMLSRFADIMFKHANPKGYVSLRAFPDGGGAGPKALFVYPITLGDKDFVDMLVDHARKAAEWRVSVVFCPPIATFRAPKNAKADNICEGLALSVECDQHAGKARQTLEAILGPATLVVASGGQWTNPETGGVEPKLHLHWRLNKSTTRPEEHAMLKEARKLATELVDGDGTNISIVHPIRWPGSWHRKATPRLAEIVASSENEIGLAGALELLRDASGAAICAGFGFKTNSKLCADDPADVASALAVIPNDNREWADWNKFGLAIFGATGGSDAGGEAFAAWSAKAKKNDAKTTNARWQHYRTSPPDRIGFGTLVYWARRYSPGWTYGRGVAAYELNEKYCVVCDNGKTRVLTFDRQVQKVGKRTHERYVATFMRFEDFANFYLDEKTLVGNKPVPVGRWWLQATKAANPGKRKYDGIVFRPDEGAVVDGKLNLWRGFGVTEKQGDWSLMRQHIEQVLASGNTDHATYIINWIAWAVQNPADRAEVALVFRGKKGTGKGTLGNTLVIIFGRHGTHISQKEHLAGRFNYHLRDACFLFADEAYWPGDKSAEGALKRLITEPDLFIEGKGQNAFPAPNLLHVMMASNEDWIVPAGENERRYAVFDVPDTKMQNFEYFAAIANQMDNGGYEAMLFDLRRRDLGNWHPRKLVPSKALLGQQERSLNFFGEWWSTVLDSGVIPGSIDEHPDCSPPIEDFTIPDDITGRETPMPGLLTRARKTDPLRGNRVTEAAFTRALKEAKCTKDRIYYCKRQRRTWRFPPLKDARKAWEKRFPGWQWSDPDIEDWQPDACVISASDIKDDD